MRSVGHMEHRIKADAPGIMLRCAISGLPPQHAGPLVHLAGDFHIPLRPEYGAGAGVGIEQPEVVKRQLKPPAVVRNLLRLVQEKAELRRLLHPPRPAGGKQAKLDAAVNAGKDLLPVLKIVQADQGAALHQVAKKLFGSVVGADAGGYDDAGPPAGIQQAAGQFGEHLIGIDIAASRQRETPAAPREVARRLRLVHRLVKLPGQLRVILPQLPNEPVARRLVGRIGNVPVSGGKELFGL